MATVNATLGNLTKVYVGKGADATVFQPICVFGGETLVDFGSYSTNKEYCLSKKEAYVALGDLEFGSQTYTYLWSEGKGDLADKIIKEAHEGTKTAEKTITIKTEVNNAKTTSGTGTTYTANFMVTNYKHMFKKGEVNKTEFSVEQLSTPKEVIAN